MQGIDSWILIGVIGIVAGWIAERLMNRHHGIIMNLIVGLVGSFIGKFLADILDIGGYQGIVPSLIASVAGAVVLLFLLGLFSRRRHH